jgi:hypothetical protein
MGRGSDGTRSTSACGPFDVLLVADVTKPCNERRALRRGVPAWWLWISGARGVHRRASSVDQSQACRRRPSADVLRSGSGCRRSAMEPIIRAQGTPPGRRPDQRRTSAARADLRYSASTKDELLRDIWGYRAPGRTRTVDSHACRLRRKLSEHGARAVVNVWGVGYRFIDLQLHQEEGRSLGDSAA